ncbi:MAG TPA: LLM class flavin-dependent oxidoreductase, partial [Acidimicrobiia bacterium]
MRLGLALPQYDYSIAGESPLPWARVVEWARAAETAGFDSLWLSDHLFLDVEKDGGPPDREGCLDPIVALAALAGEVTRVRLGTLVLC